MPLLPCRRGCMLTRRFAAGPRAAFLKAQRPELLRERNLATWLVKSDTEFAELVVGVKRASCLPPVGCQRFRLIVLHLRAVAADISKLQLFQCLSKRTH